MAYTGKNPAFTTVTIPSGDPNATPLPYFEENAFNATFTQSGGYSQTVNIKVVRIGGLVTLQIPTFSGTATAAAPILSGATDIPSRFRPSIESRQGAIITNGANAANTGGIYFTVAGQIQVYSTPAGNNFTIAVTIGLGAGGTSASTWSYKNS